MNDGIYRNTCPRNCYGTCGILSYVENNKLVKVTGDPKHGYTQGRLCAKGFAYTEFVYHPDRLKYPMIQYPRNSGNWKRISWDEAYTIIAKKMIELNKQYGSNLPLAYNKFSGNIGILHQATEGMFNSIGPHTKSIGDQCSLTGKQAIYHSLSRHFSSVPQEMGNAKLIVLWGANPAVTNVHQMKFIYEAQRKGAQLVVIDPIFTETAKKADYYIQIKPSTDKWLSLGLTKLILENNLEDKDFISKHAVGWDKYKQYIVNDLTFDEVIEKTGVPFEAIKEISQLYGTIKPTATWIGLGLQRSKYASEGIKAIDSLAAITGNLAIPNGGLYYMHYSVEDFPLRLSNLQGPPHPSLKSSREIDLSDYAKEALKLTDPPVKLLWIASRNIYTQDHNFKEWKQFMDQLELIVTVDLFMTKTAEKSDIVLPAATQFEEEDLNVGYWHYYLSLNQKAIPPYYETKSDLKIARELTEKLNELSPGFSNFPSHKEPIDWIKEELTPEIMDIYGIEKFTDLYRKAFHKKTDESFSKNKDEFQFFVPTIEDGNNSKEKMRVEGNTIKNLRLLTPQSLLKIHSQYEELSWLNHRKEDSYIEISKKISEQLNLKNYDQIELFNNNSTIVDKVIINDDLPDNVILASQGGFEPINQLIKVRDNKNEVENADETNTYFYDSFVNIKKWGGEQIV